MRKAEAVKILKKIAVVGLSLNLMAFTSPQKDDLVELKGFLYGREQAKFRTIDKNKVLVLKPGTRALVAETTYFAKTKNYGICLQVQNAVSKDPNQKCVWVYYDSDRPNMKLYSVGKDSAAQKAQLESWMNEKTQAKVDVKEVQAPAKAQSAVTTVTVAGVPELKEKPKVETKFGAPAPAPAVAPTQVEDKPLAVASPPLIESHPKALAGADGAMTDAQATHAAEVAKGAVQTAIDRNANPSMTPSTCAICGDRPKIPGSEVCNSKNSYLEDGLAKILNTSSRSVFYNMPQKEVITTACVRKNMKNFEMGNTAFRICPNPNGAPLNGKAGWAGKACLSDNYIDMTSKSFNLAADCLGGFVSGNQEDKKEAAYSVFSLMAQESGMHVNAMSFQKVKGTNNMYAGPGGPGQVNQDAIKAVNAQLPKFQRQLSESAKSNPFCGSLLAETLKKPMNPDINKSCERIDVSHGNPEKGMAYAFLYQQIAYDHIQNVMLKKFKNLVSPDASAKVQAKLKLELASWAHNTGPAGLTYPLERLAIEWRRQGRSVKSEQDIQTLLTQLIRYMGSNPHPGNYGKNRVAETMMYKTHMEAKMKQIGDQNTCIAP
jgi:hypothetical protein